MSTALATATRTTGQPFRARDLLSFELPPELEASVPPEARGITRDAVRMLVATRGERRLVHSFFSEIPRFLDEGDLVVVNTSGTLAAAINGRTLSGRSVEVHLSTRLPAGLWTLELRRGLDPLLDANVGDLIELDGEGRIELLTPYSKSADGVRLWVATLTTPGRLASYLAVHGRPIQYGYVKGSWPITMYQSVYSTEPGSAEMPSAG